jgi:hypothetical protein
MELHNKIHTLTETFNDILIDCNQIKQKCLEEIIQLKQKCQEEITELNMKLTESEKFNNKLLNEIADKDKIIHNNEKDKEKNGLSWIKSQDKTIAELNLQISTLESKNSFLEKNKKDTKDKKDKKDRPP